MVCVMLAPTELIGTSVFQKQRASNHIDPGSDRKLGMLAVSATWAMWFYREMLAVAHGKFVTLLKYFVDSA